MSCLSVIAYFFDFLHVRLTLLVYRCCQTHSNPIWSYFFLGYFTRIPDFNLDVVQCRLPHFSRCLSHRIVTFYSEMKW